MYNRKLEKRAEQAVAASQGIPDDSVQLPEHGGSNSVARVMSSSMPGVSYGVSTCLEWQREAGCDCTVGALGGFCKHRAKVLSALGLSGQKIVQQFGTNVGTGLQGAKAGALGASAPGSATTEAAAAEAEALAISAEEARVADAWAPNACSDDATATNTSAEVWHALIFTACWHSGCYRDITCSSGKHACSCRTLRLLSGVPSCRLPQKLSSARRERRGRPRRREQ